MSAEKNPRRVQIRLTFEELRDCLAGAKILDIPRDARIAHARYECDWRDGVENNPGIVLTFEHASFDAVEWKVPEAPPRFINTNIGDKGTAPKKNPRSETAAVRRIVGTGG